MAKDVTGKELIAKFLERIAITARIGIESGEFAKDEVLEFITEYGNKKIIEALEMRKSQFAMLALMEIVETSLELEEERRKDDGKESE